MSDDVLILTWRDALRTHVIVVLAAAGALAWGLSWL